MRYFTYVYQNPGTRKEYGHVTHNVYWFKYREITQVEDVDGDYFKWLGSPTKGDYPFWETDINGNPLYEYPPSIDPDLKYPTIGKPVSVIDPMRFPTDTGVPNAPEWRLATETMADQTLFYHYVREKRYR